MSRARMNALKHKFDPDLVTYIEAAIEDHARRALPAIDRISEMQLRHDNEMATMRARIAELEAQEATREQRIADLALSRISKALVTRVLREERETD